MSTLIKAVRRGSIGRSGGASARLTPSLVGELFCASITPAEMAADAPSPAAKKARRSMRHTSGLRRSLLEVISTAAVRGLPHAVWLHKRVQSPQPVQKRSLTVLRSRVLPA